MQLCGLRRRAATSSSPVTQLYYSVSCVCVMDRYHMLSGSRTVPALTPGQSREQAMVYLLALGQEKPGFFNNVAALMKVTDAAANINEALPVVPL